MAAAARGVRAAGGTCVGLLPGWDAAEAADGVDIALPTGLGEMRNALIARACAAMIAVGGGYGTLTEIALALRLGRPVTAIASWELSRAGRPDPGVHRADGADDAVRWVLAQLGY
jgi:uncharacterized protein (TIGR00725 family)